MNLLFELYPKYGGEYTARALNRTLNAVKIKANRCGYQTKHHTADVAYFDTIDTPEKAYWLGFIVADGYVVNNPNGGNYELGIQLAEKDKGHLSKFLEAIKSDAEIKTVERQNFLARGYSATSTMCSIRVHSKHMVESLGKLGVVQGKTYAMDNVSFPECFTFDFIRGYFDGDGTFSYSRTKSSNGTLHTYGRIGFVCYSPDFLKRIQAFLDDYDITSHINADRDWWTLQIRRTASVLKFCNCIYYDEACVKLDRKYIKYKHFYSI